MKQFMDLSFSECDEVGLIWLSTESILIPLTSVSAYILYEVLCPKTLNLLDSGTHWAQQKRFMPKLWVCTTFLPTLVGPQWYWTPHNKIYDHFKRTHLPCSGLQLQKKCFLHYQVSWHDKHNNFHNMKMSLPFARTLSHATMWIRSSIDYHSEQSSEPQSFSLLDESHSHCMWMESGLHYCSDWNESWSFCLLSADHMT